MINICPKAALRRIIFVNKNYPSINLEAIMVFPEIIEMYPSTNATETVEKVGEKIGYLRPLCSICDIN